MIEHLGRRRTPPARAWMPPQRLFQYICQYFQHVMVSLITDRVMTDPGIRLAPEVDKNISAIAGGAWPRPLPRAFRMSPALLVVADRQNGIHA